MPSFTGSLNNKGHVSKRVALTNVFGGKLKESLREEFSVTGSESC